MIVPPEHRAGTLALCCSKCTREASFGGKDREEACNAAVKEGWAMRAERMICPKCPKRT